MKLLKLLILIVLLTNLKTYCQKTVYINPDTLTCLTKDQGKFFLKKYYEGQENKELLDNCNKIQSLQWQMISDYKIALLNRDSVIVLKDKIIEGDKKEMSSLLDNNKKITKKNERLKKLIIGFGAIMLAEGSIIYIILK